MPPKDRQSQMRAATADVIRWQDHGDHGARARAIASVEDMVWHHARRAHRRVGRFGVDLEDLAGAGWEGALIATEKFDRTRGDYAAVAALYIHGAVGEAARRQSGVVTYSTGRRARELEIVVNRALAEAHNAGLMSNEAVIYAAEVAGIEPDEAMAIAHRSHAVSFDQEKHDTAEDDDAVIEALHDERVAQILEECIDELTPKQAEVIRAHRLRGERINDYADRAGVSHQSISNRHVRAMRNLGEIVRARGLRAEDLL